MKKISILLGILGLVSNFAFAANTAKTTPASTSASTVKEGVDYTILDKPVVSDVTVPKGKIDVKEFFSLVCVHCKDLEPLWEKQINSDKKIYVEKIHIAEGNSGTIDSYAKLSATMQMLNLNKLYLPAYNAIFNQNIDLSKSDNVKTFLKSTGLDSKAQQNFMDTYNSFGVNSLVGKYADLTKQYGIAFTPTIIIANKYELKPMQPEQIVKVTRALVDQLSKQSKSTKTK